MLSFQKSRRVLRTKAQLLATESKKSPKFKGNIAQGPAADTYFLLFTFCPFFKVLFEMLELKIAPEVDS